MATQWISGSSQTSAALAACCALAALSLLAGCSNSKRPGLLGTAGAGARADVGGTGPQALAGASATSNAGQNGAAGNGAAGSGDHSPGNAGTGSPATEDGSDGGVSEGEGHPSDLPAFEGQNDAMPWSMPAPKATCQSGDMGETGVQGLGVDVRCNLDVVGSVAATNFLSLAWRDDCAYVNDTNGTYVIDVSDDAHPKNIKTLTTPGMQNNWESMKVGASGLLVGYQSSNPVLDVYDVADDCKNPVLKKSFNLGGQGHAGNFSPDGKIYYASSLYTGTVYAVDLAEPSNPSVITSTFTDSMNMAISTHDLNTGKNGTRGYFTYVRLLALGSGSLGIVDLTDIQARKPMAKGTLIKEVDWKDTNTTQYPIPLTYRGKDYLVVTDELGSGSCANAMMPQYGYGRIFDMHDEMNPKLISLVKTAAEDPSNCQAAIAAAGSGSFTFGVGTHYCNVDRQDDPRILACGLWQGGLRIYDIRNPYRPKELAYFQTGKGDQVAGLARIMLEKNRIWVQTSSTFYVLKMPDAVIDAIMADAP